MQSKATTVSQYLKELPADRLAAISELRKVIRRNLPKGFQEGMQYGMIGYYVPHRIYPAGYHCDPKQPLPYVSLASQKNHMSIYLCAAYSDKQENNWFQKAWKETGKKLDMGKSCVRFKKIDDVPLEVVAAAVRRMTVDEFIELYESVIKPGGKPSRSASTKRVSATRAANPSRKTPTIKKKKAAKKKQVPVKKSAKKRLNAGDASSASDKKRSVSQPKKKKKGTTAKKAKTSTKRKSSKTPKRSAPSSTQAGGARRKTSKSSVRMKKSKRSSK